MTTKPKPKFNPKTGPFCGAISKQKRAAGQEDYLCKLPAGFGTEHLLEGRCKFHGGCTPIKSGRYSRVTTNSIKDLFDKIEVEDGEPLNLIPDLNMARAMLVDYVNRYEEFITALLAWHSSFGADNPNAKPRQVLDIADASRMIERVARIVSIITKQQEEGSITIDTFKRLQEQMAITVARNIDDIDKLKKIQAEWGDIRVSASNF